MAAAPDQNGVMCVCAGSCSGRMAACGCQSAERFHLPPPPRMFKVNCISIRLLSSRPGTPLQQAVWPQIDMVCVCRIVQWEDGSMQLFVGSEVLDLQPRDNSANNTHLFARHKEVMQVGALDLQPVAYHASPLRWCVCLEHPPASWCWRSWLWQPR